MAAHKQQTKRTQRVAGDRSNPAGGRRIVRIVLSSIVVLSLLFVSIPLSIQGYLAEVHLKQGVTNLAAKRYTVAEKAFGLAAKRKPYSWRPHYHLGMARSAAGNFDEAVDAYRETLRLNPNYAAALTDLGVALVQRGSRDKSTASFKEAKECLKSSLNLAPEHPKSLYFMAVCESRLGEWEEALGHFEAALTEGYESKANLYQNLAVVYSKLGNREEALEHFNEALLESPEDPAVNYQAGVFLNQIGMYDDARKSLLNAARAISTDKTNPDIGLLRSVLEGLIVVSLDGLNDPATASVYLWQYTTYAGKSPQAVALVDRFVAAVSTEQFARNHPRGLPRINYYVASALLNVGRADDAIERIKKRLATVSDPTLSVATQVLLARCYLALNDTETTLSVLKKVEASHPGDYELWRTYGETFLQAGRVEEAVAAFRKAVSLNPDDEKSKTYLKKLVSN